MRFAPAFLALFVGLSPVAEAQRDAQLVDLVRLAEAFRLARDVQDTVWSSLGTTAFPVLLVTAEEELLVDYPRIPPGFERAGHSAVLRMQVSSRSRQFDPSLLATFPAFGLPPVVVVGRAEATKKTSTAWVLAVLHEHFHQYQMSDPEYFSAIDRLGLSNGDQTGMWMLSYPFPYKSIAVADAFAVMSRQLAYLLRAPFRRDRQRFWKTYGDFLDALSERDRLYLSFQIWQEGIARYVELRFAEVAADNFHPSLEFLNLPDADAFSDIADKMRTAILSELENPNLQERQRVSFYAFGAGLALLLDQEGGTWRSRYLTEKFFVERYADFK